MTVPDSSVAGLLAPLTVSPRKPGAVSVTFRFTKAGTSMLKQLREGWTYVSKSAPLRTILMLFAVVAGAFLAFRYYGLRQGWWTTLLPMREISAAFDGAWNWTAHHFERFLTWLRR